jgi:8-oxo-dGTP pyrophosphatase MutT (NUDIX family)
LLVAMSFITAGDVFYFQRRSNDVRKGAAGMLGCFGGQVGPGEPPRRAIAREVAEETTLVLAATAFAYLGCVQVDSDHDLHPVTVDIVTFAVELPVPGFRARDGALVELPALVVAEHLGEMTPGTSAAYLRFVSEPKRPGARDLGHPARLAPWAA